MFYRELLITTVKIIDFTVLFLIGVKNCKTPELICANNNLGKLDVRFANIPLIVL